MHVLHVISSADLVHGGPSHAIRSITRALSARGVQVDVATTAGDRASGDHGAAREEPTSEWGQVKCHYFRRETDVYGISVGLTSWLVRSIRNYDTLHIHGLFSWIPCTAALVAKTAGIPYVIRPFGVLNRWGMENRRPTLKRVSFALVERRLLEHASAVHYTSQQEHAEASILRFRHNPVIIPNPVEFAPLTAIRASAGRFRVAHPEIGDRRVVLYLSRLHPKKGVELLLTAFAQLLKRMPSIILAIAGSGEPSYEDRLRKQVAALNLENSVIWTGFLSGAEKNAAFADADVFVLPSYSENFGVAVVEAMAAGLPVVTTAGVALHEQIRRMNAGLITSTVPDDIEDALHTMLSDRTRLAALGNNAVHLAQNFSSGSVVGRIIELYSAVRGDRCNGLAI